MSKWKNIKIGEESVGVKYSDKHGRWDILHNAKLYFCHGMNKTTNPVQVADAFIRNGKDTTVFYI